MAYYWIPKKYRSWWEPKLDPKTRSFIDQGEKYAKYNPLHSIVNLVKSLPSLPSPEASRTRGGVVFSPYNKSSRKRKANIPKDYKPRKIQAGESSIRPKKMPKRTRSRGGKGGKGSSQYAGGAQYRGRFKSAVRKIKKAKYPCVQKVENAVSGTAAETLYLGHCTHPLRYVMRMIGMSMVHKFYQQNGIKIRSWREPCGAFNPAAADIAPAFNCKVIYQDSSIGTASAAQSATVAQASSGDAYLTIADEVANGLVNLVTSNTTDLFITQVIWECIPNASTLTLSSKLWDAPEVRIAIRGTSMLQVQNRTAAGDDPDTTLTTSIYANPLIGKHYLMSGNYARVKNLEAAPGFQAQHFTCSSDLGAVSANSNDPNFSGNAQDILRQPPRGSYFWNCKGETQIRLAPGSIKQSRVSSTVVKPLNQWLRHVQSHLESATDVATIPRDINTPTGMMRLIAFEKVADMGSSNPVIVSGERDAVYQSKLYFRKRTTTLPTNQQL